MDKFDSVRRLPPGDIYDTRALNQRTGDSETAQDDYATRRVPATWRWSAWSSVWAFSGISTAMAFPLTAALLAYFYGGSAVVIAILLTLVYAAAGSYYMAKKAAEEGAIIELMSKHTFGYKGSAYLTIIYGILGTVYFSLEAHVMSSALAESVSFISYEMAAAIICIAFVPLTIYGMQFLAKFQSLTVVLYVAGIILAFYGLFAGWSSEVSAALADPNWWSVNPNDVPLSWVSVFSAFGAYSGLLGAILILLCTDTSRFARRSESKKMGVLMAIIGVLVPVLFAALFGLYLFATTAGTTPDPGVSLVRLLGTVGLLFVVLTQIRCNVINVYFGTSAFENFTSQVFKLSWKRSIYILPFMIVAYLILTSPFLDYFGTLMTMLSVFLVNWANVVLGDLLLVRKHRKFPSWTEFRRAYAPRHNKIGIYSMWVPTAVGVAMGSGYFGQEVQALAVPLTGIAAFVLPWILSSAMTEEGVFKQYFARVPVEPAGLADEHKCELCNHTFHKSDFVFCPHHSNQFICSDCCAVEKTCGEICHTESAVVFHPAGKTA